MDHDHDHEPTAPDRAVSTEISVAGATCPWCLNEALDALRGVPGVERVQASITGGCVAVSHVGVPREALVEVLRGHLHGAVDGAYGAQMVAVEPEVRVLRCGHAGGGPEPR